MESQYEEEYIYLISKHDIDRCKKEKENSIGQEKQAEHLARVIILSIVKKIIYAPYCDISYERTQKTYKEQY